MLPDKERETDDALSAADQLRRPATLRTNRLCCGSHGDRLSALLSGNVAPKARRAGLTERSRG
jgi:hypothetical protein